MKQRISSFLRRVTLIFIRFYQRTLSPDHGLLSYRYPHGFCKFTPTCSQYTYLAIEHFGVFKGGARGLQRFLRCNPFSHGGYDPLLNPINNKIKND